jgi:protein tyrosine phosphatase
MIFKIKGTFEWKYQEWKDFSHVNITSIVLLVLSIFYVLGSYSSPIFSLISAHLTREIFFLLKKTLVHTICLSPLNVQKDF